MFKLQLLGDSRVGKSSALLRFADNSFTESFISTIGVDFKIKTIDNVKLQIWDAEGQNPLRAQRHPRGTHAFILMFDITNQETFLNIRKWLQQVDAVGTDAMKFLVGTKTDLESERKVSSVDAKEFADQFFMPYIEISAKDNTNIEALFAYIATCVKKRLDEEETTPKNFEDYLKDLKKEEKEKEEEQQKPRPSGETGGCTIS